jgi:uncharacterized membrane protein
MARTTSLLQSVESYRNIIADLSIKLETVRNRLSLLEKDLPPIEVESPPEVRQAPTAGTVQPLAPAAAPQAPEQLPQTVVPHEEVEVIEPVQPPELPVQPVVEPVVVEPPEPEPTPKPAPPPLPTPPATARTVAALTAAARTSATPRAAKPAAPRRDWTNFESTAGKRWLTLAGVVILFLSAGFFLDHAFKVGWIGPGLQVLLAVITGVVMLALGEYFLRQEMRPLGGGLIGGGIMILYAALFAAYSPRVFAEPVIASQELTFALMCIVTIVGMALAIRHDAITISFLAILGGFITPILVSKGTDSRDILFSYILLLNLGVLGVAFYKKWRALDILAFVGTIAMFGVWYYKFGMGAPVGPPLAWLATFWAVFAIVPVAYHIRHKTLLTVERLVMSLLNATYGFGFAYLILANRQGDLAWVAMVMSASYLALGVLARIRCNDAKAMFGFISLSMMFLTLFMPLHFALNAITLAWAAEAVVLVYLGFLFDYRPVRIGGFIALLLGVARVFMVHFPEMTALGELSAAFANRNFWTMMCAPIASGLIAIVHQAYRRKATFDDKQIQIICTIGAGLLALVLVSFEMNLWFGAHVDEAYRAYLRNCSLAVLWALGAVGFLAGTRGRMGLPLRITGLVPLGGAILLVGYIFRTELDRVQMLALNPQFGAAMLVCGVMWAYSLTWRQLQAKTVFTIGTGLLTLLLFTVELHRWFWTMDVDPAYSDYLRNCSLVALWALGAAAFLVGTRHKAMAVPLRLTGLVPLGGAILLIGYTFATNPVAEQMPLLFINQLFGVSLLACAVMWIYSLTWIELQTKTVFTVGAGLLTLLLFSVELDRWFQTLDIARPVIDYLRNCSLTVLWAVGTLAFLAGAKNKAMAHPLRIAALVPLCGAILLIANTFTINPVAEQLRMLLINPRFGAALFICAVMWIHSLTWPETPPKMACGVLSSYLTVALLCAEVIPWVWRMSPHWEVDQPYTAWWVSTMLLSLCAAGYLVVGRLKRLMEAYSSGLVPLVIAWVCGLQAYLLYRQGYTIMFLNPRFVAVMMALAVIGAWAHVMRTDRKTFPKSSGTIAPLYVWFTISLLALLSTEPAGWLYRNVTDPRQASWIAQMSITIVWGLYASSMLSTGFWRRVMPLRLAALALFALTAVKLLLIDMANVGTIYRIISFFVMGLLMVAASYLYHKAEKQLKESDQAQASE